MSAVGGSTYCGPAHDQGGRPAGGVADDGLGPTGRATAAWARPSTATRASLSPSRQGRWFAENRFAIFPALFATRVDIMALPLHIRPRSPGALSALRRCLLSYRGVVCVLAVVASAEAAYADLPYLEERELPAERLYRAGLMVTGVKHHGGTGVGLRFEYGGFRRDGGPLRFSFESMFLSSGERRIPKSAAYLSLIHI